LKLQDRHFIFGVILAILRRGLSECDGQPRGIAGLVLPEYRKTMHQATFSIIVAESHRNLGVGSLLLEALLARAKTWHGLCLILLDVFQGNPARSLYLRMGFIDFGFQPFYSNMDGQFLGRHLMCKALQQDAEKGSLLILGCVDTSCSKKRVDSQKNVTAAWPGKSQRTFEGITQVTEGGASLLPFKFRLLLRHYFMLYRLCAFQ
jgi:hypothetical protein